MKIFRTISKRKMLKHIANENILRNEENKSSASGNLITSKHSADEIQTRCTIKIKEGRESER